MRRFSIARLLRACFLGMGMAVILGFPLRLYLFLDRLGWASSTDPVFIAQRIRTCFQIPAHRSDFYGISSAVDALEWVMIAALGAIAGLSFYLWAHRSREELLAA